MVKRNIFKPAILVMAMGAVGGAHAGIPVIDSAALMQLQFISQDISQGFSGTGQNIRQSTESIVDAIDYLGEALGLIIVETETNSVKAQEALEVTRNYHPDLAKSSVACSQMRAAGARGGGSSASTGVAKAMARYASKGNMRMSELADGEARGTYKTKEAIDRLGNEVSSEDTVLVFREEPFTEDELDEKLELIRYATNPMPANLPSKKDIEIMDADGGDPMSRAAYAAVLVQKDRLGRMQQILMEQKKNDLQRHDGNDFKELFEKLALSDEQKELTAGKLSDNQLNELMATFRAHSPVWIKEVHDKLDDKGLKNEMALMAAEQLRLLWSIDRGVNTLISISAQAEANRLAQEGPTDK